MVKQQNLELAHARENGHEVTPACSSTSVRRHEGTKVHEVLAFPLRAPSRLCDFVVKQRSLILAHARENGHKVTPACSSTSVRRHEVTKNHEELKQVMHFDESTLSISHKTTQMRGLSKHLRDMYKI